MTKEMTLTFQNLGQVSKIVLLSFGVTITIWGGLQLNWPQVLPWANDVALLRFTLVLLAVTVLVGGGSVWTRVSPLLVGSGIALFVALATGNTWQLLAAALYIASALMVGRAAFSIVRIDLNQAGLLNAFLFGAGILATAVSVAAHLPINYVGVYGLALAVPIALRWRDVATLAREAFGHLCIGTSKENGVDWLAVSIAVAALLQLTFALLPEVSFDALALHLLVSGHLTTRHEWGFDPSLYAMALIPMLGDWTFAIGYMIAGENGARLVNLAFTLAMALQIRELVLWLGGSESGAKWASLLFLSMPLAVAEISSLHVEAVWGAFAVAGVFAILKIVDNPDDCIKGELNLGGAMLGFAASAKAVTLCFIPLLTLLLLFQGLLRPRAMLSRKVVGAALLGLVLFIAFGSSPYLTAWLIAGNPLHPFYNGIFKSPFYPPINFDNSLFKSGVSWDTAYDVVFRSGNYLEATVGASGFQWILLFPASLAALSIQRTTRGLALVGVGILSVCVVFYFQSYLRYIYPCTVLLLAPIGVLLSRQDLTGRQPVDSFGHLTGAFCIGLNLLFFTSATWTFRDYPVEILLDSNWRNEYLERRQPIRAAVDFVNRVNSARSPVAIFAPPLGAGLNADALYVSWYNFRFEQQVNAAKSSQEIVRLLASYNSSLALLDDDWATASRREMIAGATTQIARFGKMAVLQIREDLMFSKELLQNPELNGLTGWSTATGVSSSSDLNSVLVTRDSPAVQRVSVEGNTRYLNTVTARCGKTPSQGRVQVNWLDADMKFIATNITVFDCNVDWHEYRQLVTSPRNASFAVVYGTAHMDVPIEVTRISFR